MISWKVAEGCGTPCGGKYIVATDGSVWSRDALPHDDIRVITDWLSKT